jgi:hypothetical protein
MRIRTPRRGYALLLVLVLVVLFSALWGVAYRQIAAAVRVEAVNVQQTQRDQGSTEAVAMGLTLLETGAPPLPWPYSCAVTLNTPAGPISYTVTFTSEGPSQWAVSAFPTAVGQSPPPMPATFGP